MLGSSLKKKTEDNNGDNGSLLSCYPFYVFTVKYNYNYECFKNIKSFHTNCEGLY